MTPLRSLMAAVAVILFLAAGGTAYGAPKSGSAMPSVGKPASPSSPWNVNDTLGNRTLGIRAVYRKGAVSVRWATGQTAVWDLIRTGGVLLFRQKSTQAVPSMLNNGTPITVWREERWKAMKAQWPTAARVATLLRDNPRQKDSLTAYGYHDLQQNKLTALLLMAEFHYGTAVGLALGFSDSTIEPDGVYRYIVRVVDPVTSDTLSAETVVGTGTEELLAPVTGLAAQGRAGYIVLSWVRTPTHSGYYLERQDAPGGQFRRLTKQPLIFARNIPGNDLYRDSVKVGIPFAYRVVGTDAFERESPVADTVKATALPKNLPFPPNSIAWKAVPGGVLVTWKKPPVTPAIAGYVLMRSKQSSEGYVPIHKKLIDRDSTSFLDSLTIPGTYFYRMVTSDTGGNLGTFSVRAMATIEDTIPPAPPRDVRGSSDTTGRIRLSWSRGAEADLKGYRVYRQITGGAKPEFLPITPSVITDTTFVDSVVKTARDKFTYHVKTVDAAGNYSAASANAIMLLPDINAPVKPVVTDYSVKDRCVTIKFLSPSRDVTTYRIVRTDLSGKKVPLEFSTRFTSLVDSSATHGVMFEYVITAADSSGNVSEPSKPLRVKPFWTVALNKPAPPMARLVSGATADSVLVEWHFPSKDAWAAVVFESASNGSWVQKSPLVSATRYMVRPPQGGIYKYAVKYYYPEQGSTPRSDEVSVTVGK